MKKALAVLAVAGLAAAACVPFAACGGDEAENYTSQEVDEATFLAAFAKENFENVVFEGTMSSEGGEGDEYGKSTAQTKFVIDGSKEYMTATTKYEGAAETAAGASEVTLEAYYSVGETQSETTVYFKNEAGSWQTTTANMSYGYSMYQPSEMLEEYSFDEEDYAGFSFNEEKKGYYFDDGEDTIILKFKDGKLYYLHVTQKMSQVTVEVSFVFTYGGQSVTLPTV